MEKRQKSDHSLVQRAIMKNEKDSAGLTVVEDEDYAATVGRKAGSTESGSKPKDEKAPPSNADKLNSKTEKESSSKSVAGKEEPEKGRKLRKLFKALRSELKEKKSSKQHLLDKAEKLAKSVFKKRKPDGSSIADGKRLRPVSLPLESSD